jgi:hypothetical protein
MLWRILYCTVMTAGLLAQERPIPPAPTAATPFRITGVVLDAVTGKPIRQALVSILPEGGHAFTAIVTGEDGLFVFPKLAPGRYRLTVDRHGYLVQSFNQHEFYSSSIRVGPDLSSNNLVFRLTRECAISGRISDEAGESIRDTQVTLYEAKIAEGEQRVVLAQSSPTDDEGVYQFSHLRPGKYFVVVRASPWYARRPALQPHPDSSDPGTDIENQTGPPLDVAYPVTLYPGVTEESAATPIVLRAGDHFVADINLQPVPTVHIRIPTSEASSAGGKPVFLELRNRLFGEFISGGQSEVLPSGDVEIGDVVPGHYEVDICEDGPCNGRRAAAKSAEVDAWRSGESNLEHETPTVHVSVAVQLDPGTAIPLEGSLQLFCPKTKEMVSERLADAAEIEFRYTIQPGRYELSLSNSLGEFIKTASVTGGVLSGYTLEVKDPGLLKLTVTIARGRGSVVGVALRDGKPVNGAMIVMVPADPANNHVLFERAQSESDGAFTIRAVVPGKYTLLAIEHGWDLEWSNPAVLKRYLAAGRVLQVDQDGKYEAKLNVQ